MPCDWLEQFRVAEVPERAYYVPDFISQTEETRLVSDIRKTPGPKWTQLSNRRLQNWGGVPHPKGMIAEQIPPWLNQFVDRVNSKSIGIFENGIAANHVLLNQYNPGEGIMPHLDGDLFYPTISTISVGSHTVLHFYAQDSGEEPITNLDDRKRFSFLIEPRSLLVLQQEMYTKYLHGIEEVSEDVVATKFSNLQNQPEKDTVLKRGTRFSLTIRHVPRTTKLKIKFGK